MITFVISLKGETQRRENALQECQRYDLEPIFIDAVDMRQADQATIEQYCDKPKFPKASQEGYITNSELGCALSHLSIYQKMIDENIDKALILEDDIMFIRDGKKILQQLDDIATLTGFDILILGYVKTPYERLNDYYKIFPIKKQFTFGEYTIGKPWKLDDCGTVCYVITQAGAKKMLSAMQRPQVAIDNWYYFNRHYGVSILHLRPCLALENISFESTIRDGLELSVPTQPWKLFRRKFKGMLKSALLRISNGI